MNDSSGIPSRAFSRLHRRIDPTLAAEDTNTVYQMFREKRLRQNDLMAYFASLFDNLGGMTTALMRFVIVMVITLTLTAAAAFFLSLGRLAFIAFLGLPLYVYAGIRLGQHLVPSRQFDSRKAGVRISSLVTTKGYNAPMLMDLWQCGIEAREIGEAISLEYRETRIGSAIPNFVILTLPVLAMFIFKGRFDAVSWYAVTAWTLLVIGLMATMVFGAQAGAAAQLEQLRCYLLRLLPDSRYDAFGNDVETLFRRFIVYIPLIYGVMVSFSYTGALLTHYNPRNDDLTMSILIYGFELLVLAVAAVGLRNDGPKSLERALDDFEIAFKAFMEQRILNPPEEPHS